MLIVETKDISRFELSYYLNSVIITLILAFGVIISEYLIGEGALEDETNADTNSVVSFNYGLFLAFVIYIAIGALIFYIIFTRLRHLEIRVIYAGVIGFSLLYFIGEVVNELVFKDDLTIIRKIILALVLITSPILLIRFLIVYATGQTAITIRNFGIVWSSIAIGRLIAIYFDLIAIIYFSAFLAVFDIWNVFWGPLSKVIGKPKFGASHAPNQMLVPDQVKDVCEKGTPVFISMSKGVMTGIGDLFFFTLLLYRAYIEWEFIGILLTFVAISLGSITTMAILRRISPLPGLPIPVLYSLVAYTLLSNF
jgi:hypothetical protein